MIINNVRLLLDDGISPPGFVAIRGGKIAEIGQGLREGGGETYDGKGFILTYGLIDIHTHGNSGYDFMHCSQSEFDAMARFLLRHGVTAFLASVMTAPFEDMLESVTRLADFSSPVDGADMRGIHVEGPFINKLNRGAQPEEHIAEISCEFIDKLIAASGNKIRMITLAPELKNALGLIEIYSKKGIVMAIGHSSADYDLTKAAIKKGARVATHLFNGMAPIHHRCPGIAAAVLNSDGIMAELIYDKQHLSDGIIELAIRAKKKKGIIAISDSISATGLGDGEYRLGNEFVNVKNGISRIGAQLAGSTLTLDNAVRNFLSLGLPFPTALRYASRNPAAALRLENESGSIGIGKTANLLLTDEKFNIKEIFKAGEIIKA